MARVRALFCAWRVAVVVASEAHPMKDYGILILLFVVGALMYAAGFVMGAS